jgi:2-polyprenyl-3-methyl-5-hydroxy-6-metoxy-1,4-benzoquinol methylase
MNKKKCPACDSVLVNGLTEWHYHCVKCNYESSSLLPKINNYKNHLMIDEDARTSGLYKTRIKNFKKLILAIEILYSKKAKILDVGCAHGWFLEVVSENGFDALGIEPDQYVYQKYGASNKLMRLGYFPEALEESEKFDLIVFNDVIEHIPDIDFIVQSCKLHLKKDGALVINLPSSNGMIYRVCKVLCKLKVTEYFERLWQKDMPSPHVHYFNLENLTNILKNNGFEVKKKGVLSTISLSGLYQRISYAKNKNFLLNVLIFIVAISSIPLLKIFPKDIIYIIASESISENDK